MRILTAIKRRLADSTGAATEEFSFLTVVALAIVASLLFFFRNVGFMTTLLTRLFSSLFDTLINQIVGLFS